MKTTFLLTESLSQLVLHPETKADRALLELLHDDSKSVEVHRGQFAECQAKYVRDYDNRQDSLTPDWARRTDLGLPDTILVMRPATPQEPQVVEKIPDDVDLVKKTDGTWLYRNHAGTWQGCPPPFPVDNRYEVEQLKAELRTVRDLARASTPTNGFVAVSSVSENMDRVVKICDDALGDRP